LWGQRKGEVVSEVREKDVLNVEATAEFLGFAPYTIREKARDGEIPGRKIGGEWRFSRRQLLEWLEEGSRHTANV
jgi:excisionase family DNA binding protein